MMRFPTEQGAHLCHSAAGLVRRSRWRKLRRGGLVLGVASHPLAQPDERVLVSTGHRIRQLPQLTSASVQIIRRHTHKTTPLTGAKSAIPGTTGEHGSRTALQKPPPKPIVPHD